MFAALTALRLGLLHPALFGFVPGVTRVTPSNGLKADPKQQAFIGYTPMKPVGLPLIP